MNETINARTDSSHPNREQWLWLGAWQARRNYTAGSVSKGIPVVKDGAHVYACKHNHFSTEYDQPGTGSSFWDHVPEFCCQKPDSYAVIPHIDKAQTPWESPDMRTLSDSQDPEGAGTPWGSELRG